MRCAHARDYIFALCVDEIFAVKNFLAAGRIARECHAGCACLAHVAENHHLNVHGRAPIVGNAVLAAINNCAVVHPRTENCADRAPELFLRILGKRFSSPLFDQGFEAFHQLLQIGHA